MKKKTKVVTVVDPAIGRDGATFIQAAGGKKGVIHILRTGTMPFIPESTPAPASDVYEKIKKALDNRGIKLPSPDMADAMAVYMGTHAPWERPAITKGWYTLRPPSTHHRVYKPGRKIRSIQAYVKHLAAGGHIYYNHKFMHCGFAWGLPLRTVAYSMNGRIRKAVRI